MKLTLLLGLALVASAYAGCENSCSGHGTCGADEVCTCYQDWQMGDEDGGDCSDRTCPFEISWVDRPNGDGRVHKYAECSNRGACDRTTGMCECFEGFTGKACQRTTCPNDCSGHGTCEYLEDLPYGEVYGDYFNTANVTAATYGIAWMGQHLGQDAKTFDHKDSAVWDRHKSRACVCDPKWSGIDCARRMCPKGNDVLDTRIDTSDSQLHQVQEIVLYAGGTWGDGMGAKRNLNTAKQSTDILGQSFALTFTSQLNETFTTIPIKLGTGDANTVREAQVQNALLGLPNKIIDGITADVTAGGGHADGAYAVRILLTFTGDAVQGRQNLVEVEHFKCAEGCTPRRDGISRTSPATLTTTNKYRKYMRLSYVAETTAADFNSYECGRRGKCDYDSGVCECFEGYTGEHCGTQSALV
jgi:hypothetical protein